MLRIGVVFCVVCWIIVGMSLFLNKEEKEVQHGRLSRIKSRMLRHRMSEVVDVYSGTWVVFQLLADTLTDHLVKTTFSESTDLRMDSSGEYPKTEISTITIIIHTISWKSKKFQAWFSHYYAILTFTYAEYKAKKETKWPQNSFQELPCRSLPPKSYWTIYL